MDSHSFESHISAAIQEIPAALRDKITNVAFVIEDDPRAAKKTEQEIRAQGTLLGLYQGVPLPARSGNYSGVLPDKITIFKNAIEQHARQTKQPITQLIRSVVHHEIAHYFGMDESRVRNWETKRKTS